MVTGAVLVASCASPSPAPAPKAPSAANTPTAANIAEGSPKRPAHKPRPAYPERRPEMGITTPMKGEPTAASLAEARLVATTCEKVSTDETETRLKEMRRAVDASFKDWHDAQPGCWEEMREEWRWRQQELKDSAGGIGLGSVGTIGHGAGYGASAPAFRSASSALPRPPMQPSKEKAPAANKASGTNNQVVGVDEADIVKTDGRYVYFAMNGSLRIAEALSAKMVSSTQIAGVTRELFVEGDRAVVYTSNGFVGKRCTYGYDCTFRGDGTSTKVSVFDIHDRHEPKLVRELDLSGSLMAARRIGNAVHTVIADNDASTPPYATTPPGFETCGTPEAKVRESFAKLKADNEKKIRSSSRTGFPTITERGVAQPMCNGLLRTPIRDGQSFTSVVSFDLADDKTPATTATLQSRPGAVFASSTGLYLSVTHQKQASAGRWYSYYAPSVDEVSEIHKFKIGANPNETRYIGSGTVPGHVLNQFAMDEWYGYLRVATTKGRVPDPKVESAISILAENANGNLTRVGAIDKIAPGEDIRAVRFDDDRGYVVTFKKTDPLFVLDLFQPTKPAILGELKIPGFSTYIHRIDPEHLMSIGFDADDHGSFAYYDGIILQLFDVKNPTDPKLIHKEKIGTRGSSSEAATDHLAFNYFASEGLLAVPMTLCEGGGDGRNGSLTFSGLLVYDVDIEGGFKQLGGVDHGTKGVNCNTWWSNASSAVKRSVFLDDLVYSIAGDRAKVQRLGRLGVDVADLSLMP
jgi:hypothetical protein